MICERCDKEYNHVYGSGRFCSALCAYSRGPRTEDFKNKVSKKLKGNIPWNKHKTLVQSEHRECITCNTQFDVKKTSTKIYCSKKCNPNLGGYREGSGRAKTGHYKGIYCGSTYELVWVIYQIDNNLPFERFGRFLQDDKLKYLPDFVVGNTIIEIKGYEDKASVAKKTKLAESKGYSVKILKKEDLAVEFKWVKDHYKFKNLFELYDDYKPKYSYVCSCCKREFTKDAKAKTNVVFCSRSCAGKGHKGVGNIKGYNQHNRGALDF